MNKYKAVRTKIDGITFASKKEAEYYQYFKKLLLDGVIKDLKLQEKFVCTVKGVKICTYIADFTCRDGHGKYRVFDVKGVQTPVFRLKKKLVEALYPDIVIELVK